MDKNDAKILAENHVDWLLEIIRPLLITEFEQGFKHGVEAEKINGKTPTELVIP